MLAALIVSSIGLSFAGLDAPPPTTFSGLDAPARAVVRTASLVRPVDDAAPAFEARPGLVRTLAPASYSLADTAGYTWTHADPDYLRRWVEARNEARTRYGVPSVPEYARPVYVGGFYQSYGYSAGSCASGSCARR